MSNALVSRAGKLIPVLTIVTAFLAGATIWLTITSLNQGSRLTKIERSPCTEAAANGKRFAATEAGRTCNRVRRDIVRRESLRNQCIMFKRVTGRIPPRCVPGARGHPTSGNAGPRVSRPETRNGGGNDQPSTASEQPAPGDGGTDQPDPVNPPDTGGSEPTPPAPPSEPADNSLLGPTLDGVNDTLDNTCDAVSSLGVPLC